jgi:hypothetical protein
MITDSVAITIGDFMNDRLPVIFYEWIGLFHEEAVPLIVNKRNSHINMCCPMQPGVA